MSLYYRSSILTLHVPILAYLGIAAPEIAESANNTSAADVFSFGMTLIHIVTNKQPYGECKNLYQVCRMIQDGIFPP
jgi:hypothetical protein